MADVDTRCRYRMYRKNYDEDVIMKMKIILMCALVIVLPCYGALEIIGVIIMSLA